MQAAGSRAASDVPMQGLMQEHSLVVSDLLEYAVRVHGDREIVSRTIEDPSQIHRCVLRARARPPCLLQRGRRRRTQTRAHLLVGPRAARWREAARAVQSRAVLCCLPFPARSLLLSQRKLCTRLRYTYRDAGERTKKLANALAGARVCVRAFEFMRGQVYLSVRCMYVAQHLRAIAWAHASSQRWPLHCARRPGRRRRRPGGNNSVERLPPFRAVLRHLRQRRRAPHHQPASLA